MKKRIVIVVLAIIMLLGIFVPATFAWLNDSSLIPVGMNSYVHKSYFESGDGTGSTHYSGSGSEAGCAYEIKYPVQLYYFAWLQYLGYFNQPIGNSNTINQVYFWVSADLDMSGWVLPPIGTTDFPFVGNFDGNGHTITNLTIQNVETSSSDVSMSDFPVNSLSGTEIVGFFGVIGSLSEIVNNQGNTNGAVERNGVFVPTSGYTYSSLINKVENFSINAITINTETSDSLIGALAGYVNGTVSEVAIANTNLIVKSGTNTLTDKDYTTDKDNISDYALVGYCTEPYKFNLNVSKVTATMPVQTNNVMYKRSQGEGAEWGGSIDMKSMHTRLQEILTASKSYTPQTYADEEIVEIDEVNQTRKVTPLHYATYESITDSTDSTGKNVRYYYSVDSGSYVFADYKNTNSEKYDMFHGVSARYFPKTVTTITKKNEYKNGYKISDGTHYLVFSDGNITDGTDGTTATAWAFEGNAIFVYSETGYIHYLNGSNTLSISNTNSTTWQWDSTSENFYYSYAGSRHYLAYDNGWTVISPLQVSKNGNYLNIISANGTTATVGTTGANTAWMMDGNGYIYAKYNGTVYYLKNNNGSLTATSSTSNRSVWVMNNSTISTGDYSLCYDNGWKLSTRTLQGYTISYNGNYLNATSTSAIGTGTPSSSFPRDNGHTVWTFSSTGDNPSGTISVKNGSDTYYLYVSRSWFLGYTYSLSFGSSTNYRTWTNSNNSLYLNYSGNRYITYNSGWKLNTSSMELQIDSVYQYPTGSTLSVSDTTPSESLTRTNSSVQIVTRSVTTEAGGHDTYFPLTVIGGNGSDKWNADDRNTGYIVGGSHTSYQEASGDVRVSSYYTFTGNLNGKPTYLNRAVNGNTYTKDNLEVLTRTYLSNGFKRISDTYNSSNNSVSSQISGINKIDRNELGLKKYDSARSQLDDMFMLQDDGSRLDSYNDSIYGMHFMDSVISANNLIVADKVKINGETYDNYQMPEDCIDFYLKSKGFINFFSGTYYVNSGKENNCFFSLNQIFRNDNNAIIAIKRIAKIYGNPNDNASKYIYEYGDGSFSEGNSTPNSNGYVLMFDTDWIERPDTLIECAMYYFEIPVNAGEYALGSVEKKGNESSRYGAYLCYLDIGTSGSTEDKDRVTVTERFTIENANNVRIPKGVQLVAQGQSFDTEDIYETVTIRLSDGYNGTYVLSRTGDVFNYVTQTNATMTYLGGSLLAQSTSGSGQGAITVNYHLEGGYQIKTVENITDTGKTTGVVDYLKVETVDQYDETGTRLSRTVTIFADPDLSNNTKDTLSEVGSFTYTCSNYDNMIMRCIRSASQVGFNVMFNNNVTITSVSLNGSYYFNFGDNLKNVLDTVATSNNSMSLAIAGINMSSRPSNDKEYLYNPSSIGDDLVSYYYYYDGNATLTPETSYTIALGETIGTQTVNNYTISLRASSGEVVVYAQQLAIGCTGTIYKLNSGETATEAISLSVTVTPAVIINGTQISLDSITKIVTQAQ